MDQRFVPIYDELSLEFDPGFRVGGRRSRAVYAKADRLAWDAIAEVQRRVAGKKQLRADARLFLISNLALMVTRPLLHPQAPNQEDDNLQRLRTMLLSDASQVVKAAETDERGEVSAASAIRALAGSLEQLKLKEWRLWDRVEERSDGYQGS